MATRGRHRVYGTTEYEDWLVVTEERPPQSELAQETTELKHKAPWFQGRMNRNVAEECLSKSAQFDGTFLVRESDALSVRRDPVYVISVTYNGETHHVEVEKRPNGKYAIANLRGAKEYKSLDKLIKHYRGKPIDLEGGGHTKLKYFMENSV